MLSQPNSRPGLRRSGALTSFAAMPVNGPASRAATPSSTTQHIFGAGNAPTFASSTSVRTDACVAKGYRA
jgi:hypothetical protein